MMTGHEAMEVRAVISAHLTGNLLVQVPRVCCVCVFPLPSGFRIGLLLSFSCSLTVVSHGGCSALVHLFPHSFTHSLPNISWLLLHSIPGGGAPLSPAFCRGKAGPAQPQGPCLCPGSQRQPLGVFQPQDVNGPLLCNCSSSPLMLTLSGKD